MKKVTSVLLILALAFSALTLLPFAVSAAFADEVNASPIELDKKATAAITNPGDRAFFSFTPEKSGWYVFFSTAGSHDPYGYVYSSEGNLLGYDDDGAGRLNFSIEIYLNAGESYYFAATYLGGEAVGSYYVYLKLLPEKAAPPELGFFDKLAGFFGGFWNCIVRTLRKIFNIQEPVYPLNDTTTFIFMSESQKITEATTKTVIYE